MESKKKSWIKLIFACASGEKKKNDFVGHFVGSKRYTRTYPVLLHVYVSFVTQDNFLFSCSLLENIRLGNPDATDEEVKAAQCEEFINKLPLGYNTPAGEAGKRLSGGEKQRIAIARMMLKNAPIVILDEATAFTDPENEDKIQKSIAALTKGKTLLVIVHRLSTIKSIDNIAVVLFHRCYLNISYYLCPLFFRCVSFC